MPHVVVFERQMASHAPTPSRSRWCDPMDSMKIITLALSIIMTRRLGMEQLICLTRCTARGRCGPCAVLAPFTSQSTPLMPLVYPSVGKSQGPRDLDSPRAQDREAMLCKKWQEGKLAIIDACWFHHHSKLLAQSCSAAIVPAPRSLHDMPDTTRLGITRDVRAFLVRTQDVASRPWKITSSEWGFWGEDL